MQSATTVRTATWLRDTQPAGITSLAQDLGLSRTSVENALNVLQGHNLVVGCPGSHGVPVARPATSGSTLPVAWSRESTSVSTVCE